MTSHQLALTAALGCEPDWIQAARDDVREALTESPYHDIWGQGLTAEQIRSITDVPLPGGIL
jgi:hypothetical protein